MMNQWIKITDKEPLMEKPVLITDGKVIVVASRSKGFLHEDGENIWKPLGIEGYEWDWYFDDREITHWMELPELPGNEP